MYGGTEQASTGLRRREHLLLHHPLQRALRSSRPSPTTSTSRACSRASTCSRTVARATGPKAQILVSGVDHARGAARTGAAGRGVGCGRRRLVGHLVGRAAPRRRRMRDAGAAQPRRGRARCRIVTQALSADAGPGRRGLGLDARGGRSDPPVGSRRLHHPRHRRVRLLRHPHRPRAGVQRRRRSPSWSRCWPLWSKDGTFDKAKAVEAAAKYRIDDVSAAPKPSADTGRGTRVADLLDCRSAHTAAAPVGSPTGTSEHEV